MKLFVPAFIAAIGLVVCSASQYNTNFYLQRISDPQCSDFDSETGKCVKCYTGYYLDHQKVCQKNPNLCAECNADGKCTVCFNKYVLINGKCYHEGVLQRPENKRQGSDPLCSQWKHNTCQACVAGAYMNRKGVCKIADPNCDEFDEINEVCTRCIRGYQLKNRICQRKI